MRYVVFPAYSFKDELIPSLEELMDSDITIVAGPTASGIYFINGTKQAIDLLKFMASPYYLFMEDF